jgi:hypothetical protein
MLTSRLAAFLPSGALAGAGFNPESLSASPERLRMLPPELLDPTVRALSEAITAVFLYSVPVLLVGFLISLMVPEVALRDSIHAGPPVEAPGPVEDDIFATRDLRAD